MIAAIENCPSFENLMQILDYAKGDLDYEMLFKIVATKFPRNYMDLFARLYGPVPQCAVDTPEPQDPQEPQVTYKEQFKNDPDMTQVGADIESDDEHSTMTVRSGNEWTRIRVKRA